MKENDVQAFLLACSSVLLFVALFGGLLFCIALAAGGLDDPRASRHEPVGAKTPPSRTDRVRREIEVLVETVGQYAAMNEGHLPKDLVEVSTAGFLMSVRKGEPPLDPWGRPYHYARDAKHEGGFTIWSLGPDEQDEADDIRRDG